MMARKRDYLYILFRVLVGFMFFSHGAQKLFGLFGGKVVEFSFSNIFFYAGLIEVIGGALIVGVFWEWYESQIKHSPFFFRCNLQHLRLF